MGGSARSSDGIATMRSVSERSPTSSPNQSPIAQGDKIRKQNNWSKWNQVSSGNSGSSMAQRLIIVYAATHKKLSPKLVMIMRLETWMFWLIWISETFPTIFPIHLCLMKR